MRVPRFRSVEPNRLLGILVAIAGWHGIIAAATEPVSPALRSIASICEGLAVSIAHPPGMGLALDAFEAIDEHPAGGMRRVYQGPLRAGDSTEFLLRYDDGGSCDPQFSLWLADGETLLANIDGEHLTLSGDGTLLVLRRINRPYLTRDAYLLRDGRLHRVEQADHLVAIDTTTRIDLTLVSEAGGKQPVIDLPAGSAVQVLLHRRIDEADHYLLRSGFGLLGWAGPDSGYGDDRLFEHIEYLGD